MDWTVSQMAGWDVVVGVGAVVRRMVVEEEGEKAVAVAMHKARRVRRRFIVGMCLLW
jgi:hypothetical protein